MIRRPPRSTRVRSSAASDVYKRQVTSRLESGLPSMDFEDFYGRYVDRVASYVLRHTSLRDAEDIVAETFTVAWRGASGSNGWTTRCRGLSSRRATSRGRSGA